ncbi:hypothetical protein BH10PSE11_BH10PSE11_04030 [soil metagenome]
MGMARRECVPISVINEAENARHATNLSCWQLCERLTIHQAALLILGEDPVYAVWESETPGYVPLVAAIVCAAESGTIKGVGKFKNKMRSDITLFPGNETDPVTSTIDVASLKLWLSANGRRPAAFFPDMTDVQEKPSALAPYLDKEHPRFAPKLAAAIEASEAMKDPANVDLGKTARLAIEAWLMKNAARLGLVAKDGRPIKQAIREIAKIANWNTQGGAPRTGAKLSSR